MVVLAFDMAGKVEAAHGARGPDDAEEAEEGGGVLVGGHFLFVPEREDNGRVEIQMDKKLRGQEQEPR